MRIAFDAKRAYQNGTGLGHYSRTLVSSLAGLFPENQYFLSAPRLTPRFDISAFTNVSTIVPAHFLARLFPAVWRGSWVTKDLVRNRIDLFHGLSHEIPVGIRKTGIRTVVTIHDLIFERYPAQYNPLDVQIYRAKFKYACRHADHIIAISNQTRDDIISFYHVPPEKITICYQSCNPAFAASIETSQLQQVRQQYGLPDRFFLYVGSVIERKNLLNICKGLQEVQGKMDLPLVVIGEGREYKTKVAEYISQRGLQRQVIFLSDTPEAKSSDGFQSAADFPAIYQLSEALIYPSVFEGFGIPVLEALWSKTPVITSNISCLPETGGDAALYVDPYSPEEIAAAMLRVSGDPELRKVMREKGSRHAQKFTPDKCAADVMAVYLRLNDRL
jgi:glycosyltransferase involved in cell wall biosynthesis